MYALFALMAIPFILAGVIALAVFAVIGLAPIAVMIGGGFVLFKMLNGSGPHVPAMRFRGYGPGRMAAPVEQGIFCPSCNEPVSRQWATCPHCGYRKYLAPDLIQRRCGTCGTELQKDWNACPYCSTRVDAPLLAAAPGPSQPDAMAPNYGDVRGAA